KERRRGEGVSIAGSKATVAERLERLRRSVMADRPRPPLWVREVRDGVDEESGIAWSHRFTLSEPGIALPMIELRGAEAGDVGEITSAGLDEGTLSVSTQRDAVMDLVAEYRRILLFDPR